jgi:hypothetical protein
MPGDQEFDNLIGKRPFLLNQILFGKGPAVLAKHPSVQVKPGAKHPACKQPIQHSTCQHHNMNRDRFYTMR